MRIGLATQADEIVGKFHACSQTRHWVCITATLAPVSEGVTTPGRGALLSGLQGSPSRRFVPRRLRNRFGRFSAVRFYIVFLLGRRCTLPTIKIIADKECSTALACREQRRFTSAPAWTPGFVTKNPAPKMPHQPVPSSSETISAPS